MTRIIVDPPSSDARRDRVEKKLFEQLAAVRVVERAEAVIPPERKRRIGLYLGASFAAAAAVALLLLRTESAPSPTVAAPSRIVTPVGGTSQVTLPGALIEAKSDTSVEVQHGEGGAITLVLSRGAVDCDVEPRADRPPFRVIAGDVRVEVVGTRFTVTKTPAPRVDVARGKVRVRAPGGEWLLEAGETWPVVTATVPPAPIAPVVVEAPVVTPPRKKTPPPQIAQPAAEHVESAAPSKQGERERARESYRIAAKLEQSDPRKAAQLYRAIATDGKGMEPVALLSLAEVQLKLKDPRAALTALDELARRYPTAANVEDAAWFRYEALRAMGKRDEARGAAADYLRQFPHGTYADRLRRP